jgi:hypothetical protein
VVRVSQARRPALGRSSGAGEPARIVIAVRLAGIAVLRAPRAALVAGLHADLSAVTVAGGALHGYEVAALRIVVRERAQERAGTLLVGPGLEVAILRQFRDVLRIEPCGSWPRRVRPRRRLRPAAASRGEEHERYEHGRAKGRCRVHGASIRTWTTSVKVSPSRRTPRTLRRSLLRVDCSTLARSKMPMPFLHAEFPTETLPAHNFFADKQPPNLAGKIFLRPFPKIARRSSLRACGAGRAGDRQKELSYDRCH